MLRKTFDLPLHTGKVPRWLFDRMKRLSFLIIEAILMEFGEEELLKRLANPFWFQSFGCLLGYDWHSSGLTTTLMGAIKEGLKQDKNLGIMVAGGKGKMSLKTPEELNIIAEIFGIDANKYIKLSRLVAKIDNSALQDGFQLYHHTFLITKKGNWMVIQQGMNPKNRYARRYHWLSLNLKEIDNEPHFAVVSQIKTKPLNLVSEKNKKVRKIIVELSKEKPQKILKDITILQKHSGKMPSKHWFNIKDINPKYIHKILLKTYQKEPKDFTSLLEIEGVGPKTLRALALVGDLIYGEKVSFEEPKVFSYAHGGKDGYPYRIKKSHYDKTIEILEKAIRLSKLSQNEKDNLLKKLKYI